LSGVAVVAGHCFSIPGKLKGGKGVATALGALLCLNSSCAGFGIAGFVIIFSLSRIVSLASVTAALSVPLFGLLTDIDQLTSLAMAAIALIVVYRHKDNLVRLTEGREAKINFK
ncbi:glycerol-3-phosphate acyltransferase, partial [Oligoflexia bacterium]|nr:glycerol-3-phosphate acyltransferase [Oligoflexia bacterium]